MSRCTAVKKDGTQCRVSALRDNPDHRCLFHSTLQLPGSKKLQDLSNEELLNTLSYEVKRLRKDGSLPVIARADTIRNLARSILEIRAKVDAPPPAPKPLTLAEKLKKLEDERKEN